MPWAAGLYALACQVFPGVNPEIFREAALATADAVPVKKGGAGYTLEKVVNPVRLIARLQAANEKQQAR